MGMHVIDRATWVRRPHFELFESYQYPWLDICSSVDATVPWTICSRPGGPSFFALTLFLALDAANSVEELRTRMRGDEIVVHDQVNAGATVMRDDGTFGFGFFPRTGDFAAFAEAAAAEIERVRNLSGELVDREIDDVLHFSIVPWISFTGVGHPRTRDAKESIPKIALGRCAQEGSRWKMPVAVSAHHGLVDALHISRFLDRFSEGLESVERMNL